MVYGEDLGDAGGVEELPDCHGGFVGGFCGFVGVVGLVRGVSWDCGGDRGGWGVCTSLTNKMVVRAAPSVSAEITIPGNA